MYCRTIDIVVVVVVFKGIDYVLLLRTKTGYSPRSCILKSLFRHQLKTPTRFIQTHKNTRRGACNNVVPSQYASQKLGTAKLVYNGRSVFCSNDEELEAIKEYRQHGDSCGLGGKRNDFPWRTGRQRSFLLGQLVVVVVVVAPRTTSHPPCSSHILSVTADGRVIAHHLISFLF